MVCRARRNAKEIENDNALGVIPAAVGTVRLLCECVDEPQRIGWSHVNPKKAQPCSAVFPVALRAAIEGLV
jgi:hypothetical protein